jgi:inorganic phosphate transporter, PiT family
MLMVFLSSGLFLGWSLGANDAANVFGTAVGSKMIRFKTAAIIASVFIVLGAVIGGSGAAHTLGKLGAVNAIAGSFMVAFAAGFTVFWMTKLQLPVSTSQAIVGAIIGWNFFSNSLTDYNSLTKILLTWVLCPVLSAAIAAAIFSIFRAYINRIQIHMLRMDTHTRTGLLLVGAFGAYSLGANNIANVMGVFVPVAPFDGINFGWISLSSAQILFFIGSLAIAVGVITYSKKVMDTVGSSLMRISPIAAFVIVLAEAIVLFLFSSEGLEHWLLSNGLPSIPLVPVSSSQAVVGAVIGIGLVKGGRGINYSVLGEIATGWVTTPIIAGIISFVALFFLQNVFNQQVHLNMIYKINDPVIHYLDDHAIPVENLEQFKNKKFDNPVDFQSALKKNTSLNEGQINLVISIANIQAYIIEKDILNAKIDREWLGDDRYMALSKLIGKKYTYKFQLVQDLEKLSSKWRLKEKTIENKLYNKDLIQKIDYTANKFKTIL